MGPRGAGRRLSDQERMEILEIIQREAKVKNVDLAKHYGVSEGAIRKLKQMKDTIRSRYFMGNEHNRDKRKRGGFKRNAPFENELYQWIVRMRESQPYQLMPLTQTAVRQQAIIFSKNYEKMANFKASPGWFTRFCSRHRLNSIVASVAGATDVSSIAMVATPVDVSLSSAGVPQSVTAPPAVSMPMLTGPTDETAFLMDTFTATPVTPLQALKIIDSPLEIASNVDESKTDTPSINEQVQEAARQHNEAALRAAAAKVNEVPTLSDNKTSNADSEISKIKAEETRVKTENSEFREEYEKIDGATADAAVSNNEIFSLGL